MITTLYVAENLVRQQKATVAEQARAYARRHPLPDAEPVPPAQATHAGSRWRRSLRLVLSHG
jgi:hypothetical protein